MYTLNRTDSNLTPITVDQNVTKQQAGLTWVGQYHSRFGEIQNTNFLRLLENFAGPNIPGINDDQGLAFDAVLGQLWFSTNDPDHLDKQILKIYNNNVDTGTGGWKRIEVIIDATEPATQTEGEIWYNPTINTFSLSRGTRWEDVSVKMAMDSQLLDGLDSTQFVRSDVADTVNGVLQTNTLYPSLNLAYDLGKPNYKWNNIYANSVQFDQTGDLIPAADSTYNLGNNTNRWEELNVIVTNSQWFYDVVPYLNNTYDLGSSSHLWNNAYLNNVYGSQYATITPIDNTQTIGTTANRWNNAFINILDTNTTKSLIPDSNTTYDLGSSTNEWQNLYVSVIQDATTHNLNPVSDNTYDLGTPSLTYRTLYVNNITSTSSLTMNSDLNFNIIQNSDSKGIYWTGLSDSHSITVEEFANASSTRMVINSGNNSDDYTTFRHTDTSSNTTVDVMDVKYDTVDVHVPLRAKDNVYVEESTATHGCEMSYNNTNQSLEFIFY